MSYNNRNRGRGGNRPFNNHNPKLTYVTNRRTHDYQHQQQQSNNNLELNNGVYANERFMHTTMALIGSVARVTVKSGRTYEGVFKTFSPQFEVVLDRVHEIDLMNPDNIPSREEIKSQMVFKLEDIASVLYTNVDPNYAISASADGFTDAAIIRKANGQVVEKELQPWVSDANPEEVLDDGDILESGKSNGWDVNEMFRTNRDKFKIESTYDPNMGQYTTPLPNHNTDDFKVYEENAALMAREIESSASYKQRAELENTRDEETLHSAVVRENLPAQQKQQRQKHEYLDRGGHGRSARSYTSGSLASSSATREASPPAKQQMQTQLQQASKAAAPAIQAPVDLASTPQGNYSDVVVKKHFMSTQHHGQAALGSGTQQVHHSAAASATSSHTKQSQAPSVEWKELSSKVHHAGVAGSFGAGAGHQQQGGEVASGQHLHYQQMTHHKEVSIAEQIKDLKEFQVNFNLTDIPQTTQQQNVSTIAEVSGTQASSVVTAQSNQTPEGVVLSVASGAATPAVASKVAGGSNGSSTTEGSSVDMSEKKKEATYTLNPNANEFRPRTAVDQPMGQLLQPIQVIPAVNLPQQPAAQAHLQQHKAAHLSSNQMAQQQQQLVPSTVGSPPIIYSNHTGFAVGHHPGPIFYCPSTVTPRYPAGAKRATVSARGNNDMGTPQAANIMAGAPLISQNGLPAQMFVTPQQMMINPPYHNSLRVMVPSQFILEPMTPNPMLLSASIPPLAAPPHGTPTAVLPTNIHGLLQQQQIVAHQTSNNSNGGGARPSSNGSGAPTPVHYQPGPPIGQGQGHNQGVAHHQQQQQSAQVAHQIYHGTPASLSLQAHPSQQMAALPGCVQLPSTVQSQMLFSPFIPAFSNTPHPQSAGFTAAMPPPAISGTLQGQVPPGSALHHHHQLVQHHQLQPMIIASQNQQAAAAQLGQFVAVQGLTGVPQGPQNIASPQLLYGMQPIQPPMTGQTNFHHGQ